jgi:hypothetical protein
MKLIYAILTADYELYFGKNFFSYEEVLFEPTRKIINVLENHNISLNIFPDICSVWRHKEYGLLDYVDKFESQLIEAVSRGHDVQLHLHPHWLKSLYNNDEWVHDLKTFKLQDLGFEGENALIKRGKEYLETLLKSHIPDYECIAFRAGGYCLQPEDKKLIQALLDAGIIIDSSIIPNLVSNTNVNETDFKGVPDLPNWFMSAQGGIKNPSPEGLFEIPIPSSTKILPKFKAMAKGIFSNNKQDSVINSPRGRVIQKQSINNSFISKNINRFNYLRKTIGSLECERMFPDRGMEYMLSIFRDWVERYAYLGDIFLSIIMHPKSIFQNNIDNLLKFIDTINVIYPDIRFITFSEVPDILSTRGRKNCAV